MFSKSFVSFLLLGLFAGCTVLPRTSYCSSADEVSIKEVKNSSASSLPNLKLASFASEETHSELQFSRVKPVEDQLHELSIDPIFQEQEFLDTKSIDLNPIEQNSNKLGVWERLISDQGNFYSRESLIAMGLVLGAGAALANSSADGQIHKHFQSSVRGATSDDWFKFLHANKELGNGVYTLPIMGSAWILNEYIDGPPAFENFGTWGERSMRGFIVGAPPLMVMQRLTGGSRPYETMDGSQWHPFRDDNGVSGHAFMSSLPFITAAKMTDNPWGKSLWYLGSTIGPLSRVNDNAHYPSQIGIGWAMAFMAATAVQQSDSGKQGWQLLPESPSGGSGFALRYQW